MAEESTKTTKDKPVKTDTEYSLTVTAKLIDAFQNDYDVRAACRFAGCTFQSYYNWLKWYPDFAEKMDAAQNHLSIKAGEVTARAITEGDVNTARWYKDRRDPRYKAKAEMELQPGQVKTEEKLKEFMNDTNDGAYPGRGDDSSSQSAATSEPEGGDEVAPGPTDIS